MKMTKWFICTMLLVFALSCMTGCTKQKKAGDSTSGYPTTAAAPTTKGVIGGLKEEVEKGIDDIKEDITKATETTKARETTKAP